MRARRSLICLLLAAGAVLAACVAIAAAQSGGARPGAACTTVSLAVVVDLDNTRHEHLIAHERRALERGEPRILHLDRPAANAHRAQSLRGIPTRPGFDRDEYPPAFTAEGGTGADVEYVASSENRSGGSVMSRQLLPFCDGQAFLIEP